MSWLRGLSLTLVLGLPCIPCAQTGVPPHPAPAAEPAPKPETLPASSAVDLMGLIRLDVVVTGPAGQVVAGLRRDDFSVLDNGQPQKVVAFRGFHAVAGEAYASTTLILLIDTLDLAPALAAFERQQAAIFLRQNNGQLAQPVAVYSLERSGFSLVAKPSLDGNTLAREVESDTKLELLFVPPSLTGPFRTAVVDSLYSRFPPLTALRALGTIAAAEDGNQGRKLLLWVGPGEGLGSGARMDQPYAGFALTDLKSAKGRQNVFGRILWFSELLRQAQMSVDVFSVGERGLSFAYVDKAAQTTPAQEAKTDAAVQWTVVKDAWKQFLGGVPSAQQVSLMDLYKAVLAIESGGRVLPDKNDLVGEMDACVRAPSTWYAVTFDPAPAAHGDEYHDLRIEVRQPELTAHTNTGYYDEPFYGDPPDPAVVPVTVAGLEEMIHAPQGNEELSRVRLTERLSGARLQSLMTALHSKKARAALEQLADESTFLPPPSSGVLADPPPDAGEQQRILSAAMNYLNEVIPRLPNFFARRTFVGFNETAGYHELMTAIDPVPLHVEEQSKANVQYRQGAEIVDASPALRESRGSPLNTYGTFGPILRGTLAVMRLPGSVRWSRWEQEAGERRAVFRYATPMEGSEFRVEGCCLARDGATKFAIRPGYHGEIAIDPASGAILRIQMQADLQGFVPTTQADMMVEYGPVAIGGKTYILPLRAVSIWRGRTVPALEEWNQSFHTWGPYETAMDVFTFERYHAFQSEIRMLPGYRRTQ